MHSSHRLYTVRAIRAVESQAQAALPPHALMRRAAAAACEFVRLRWPGHVVHILCGPGNNGGDGLMLAALLHAQGQDVRVWALRGAPDAARPADAAQAWMELPAGLLQDGEPDAHATPAGAPLLIVDALFGIGLSRPLPEQARRWIAWANEQDADLLALDVPSGLDADSGAAQEVAVNATHTLTFIGDKPGLHTRGGADHAGQVSVAPLELEEPLAAQAAGPDALPAIGRLIRAADCPALFRPRKQDTHKGSFGTLGLIAGAPGMTGAALLAARAALYLGAGKIFVGLAQEAPLALACDPLHPELMLRPAASLLEQGETLGVNAWVAGCGLGTGERARAWLAQLLENADGRAVVLDADALTCLGADAALAAFLAARAAPAVLTPHPLEAARLLHTDAAAVQADRIAAARELAARYGAWVVLKGAGTVVSAPDGAWSINGSGNPGLATAGTGDALAGMLGALLAQGLPLDEAVRGGVWLHGAAADELARQGVGPIGLTAGELAPAARRLRNG